MRDLQKDSITRGIKAESERCIGETECYFNLKNQIEQLQTENTKLRKVVEAARRVMDAVMAQPQDVVERNIALTWLDAALAELDKEGER